MSPAVTVTDLVKRYKGRPSNAVDGISFEVGRREIFGLLGPNGAGKSTTIGVLTTRVLATSGSATVAGVDVVADPVRARAGLAVVPQRPNLDRELTARQNLVFHAAYHGVGKAEREQRATDLLEQFGLGDRGGDKTDKYSGGQAQRLMIARALMHRPSVLFLDEPSTGLDPQARLFVWDRVRELRDSGVTIVLTTHDMDEATTLCDRVGIVDHGKVLALDTPTQLVRSLPGSGTVELGLRGPVDDQHLVQRFADLPGVERAEPAGTADDVTKIRLYVAGDPAALLAPIAGIVQEAGVTLADVGLGELTLEDVFISMTGRGPAVTAVQETTDSTAPSPYRVFGAVLRRDLFVTGRDLWIFLAQVLLQPLFLLFVFGKVLASIGATQAGYGDLLFPGIVALTAFITSLQGTALPLVLDFSFSREIEDRLLAPMPVMWVAVEKIVFATLRAIIAAAVMFPVGVWVLGSIPLHADGALLLVVSVLVGALLGSAVGMTLGTFVPVNRINIMFALILTPLIFTGCTQYPWPSLSTLRWFQVVTAFNPLTYVSEATRAALVPEVPHMSTWISVPAMLAWTVLFVVLGLVGFRRRALD